ncbi:hypothetical protein B0T14DRAFT_522527 [Immersiella caudata]|uniref:Uncharacterized protein n=1 Tax=Immersiella caudata TaxID=314043 RepID=A0AA39WSV8_9PEZI|nr:hypothetical protein B0T14DRAFT_522527 [Immersiella caudata]
MPTSTAATGSAPTTALEDNVGGSTPIYTFSSGLVQISGLAGLVGGNGLGELSLGLKAASGFAWSPISCFGILKVVQAFVAGSIANDTWRDVLGLRTGVVDDALGFGFWTSIDKPTASGTPKSSVRSAMQQRGARLAEERVGICLDVPDGGFLEDKLTGWHSLVKHDRLLRYTLAGTSAFEDEKSIQVHSFIPDDTAHDYHLVDWVLIAASMVKASEAIVLFKMGSNYLWWSNMLGSACCLTFAVILQALNLGRDTHRNLQNTADFLIGDLPSYQRIGSLNRKIILAQPVSVRKSRLWRGAWAAGVIANSVGVGITFYVLVKELEGSIDLVYVWMGFQILWVLLRTFVYHIIPDSTGPLNINLTSQKLESIPESLQARVLRLLLAASLVQTKGHVRVYEAYLEDIQSVSSPQQLIGLLHQAKWNVTNVLRLDQQDLPGLTIEAIVGEHILRTFAWITCAKIDNAEIYDAVAALFRKSNGEQYLVPGVRVMACKPRKPVAPDPEAAVPSFDSRGTVNKEKIGYWVYWFPLHMDRWLEVTCGPFSALGSMRGQRILTSVELDEALGAGTLSIGLRGTADLSLALEASRACSHVLLGTVKGLRVSGL